MKIKTEHDCGDCPFSGWNHPSRTPKVAHCGASERNLPVGHLDSYDEGAIYIPPGWCELRDGSITVVMTELEVSDDND